MKKKLLLPFGTFLWHALKAMTSTRNCLLSPEFCFRVLILKTASPFFPFKCLQTLQSHQEISLQTCHTGYQSSPSRDFKTLWSRQRMQRRSSCFRVILGMEDVRFNEHVIMDIMTLDKLPLLHIIDDGPHFSAAYFIPDVSTPTVWKTNLYCWASVYTGLPNSVLIDGHSQFGKFFIYMARASDVKVSHTGIEAHSSLDPGECNHEPLHNIFKKLTSSHPIIYCKIFCLWCDRIEWYVWNWRSSTFWVSFWLVSLSLQNFGKYLSSSFSHRTSCSCLFG